MNNRRVMLNILGATIAAAVNVPAQPAKSGSKLVHAQPLPHPFDGYEARFVEVTVAPGNGSAPHSHGGFVLGYVDGEFRFATGNDQPRVIHAGEAFYEAPGARHTVSASARPDREVRLLAIVIAEKGKPTTTLE